VPVCVLQRYTFFLNENKNNPQKSTTATVAATIGHNSAMPPQARSAAGSVKENASSPIPA